MTNDDIEYAIKSNKNWIAVAKSLGYSNTKRFVKYAKDNSINISHFQRPRIYNKIIISCPVCGNKFEDLENHPRQKKTCSYACSNTFFRSGEDNPNWKESRYNSTCFLYHGKKCAVCEETKIVEVHHMDEDRSNNKPFNLIPLCPTHHQYWHSRWKSKIEHKVLDYIKDWKLKQ